MSKSILSLIDIARDISSRKNSQSIENWKGTMSGLDWSRMREDITKRVEPYDLATQVIFGGTTFNTIAKNMSEMMHSNKIEEFLNPNIIKFNNEIDTQNFIRNHSQAYDRHLELSKKVADIFRPNNLLDQFLNKDSYQNSFGYTPIDIISGTTFLNVYSAAKVEDATFNDLKYIAVAEEVEEQLESEGIKEEIIALFNDLRAEIKKDNQINHQEILQKLDNIEKRIKGNKISKIAFWFFNTVIIGILLIMLDHAVFDKEQVIYSLDDLPVTTEEITLEIPTDIFTEMNTSSSAICISSGTKIRVLENFEEWSLVEFEVSNECKRGWIKNL